MLAVNNNNNIFCFSLLFFHHILFEYKSNVLHFHLLAPPHHPHLALPAPLLAILPLHPNQRHESHHDSCDDQKRTHRPDSLKQRLDSTDTGRTQQTAAEVIQRRRTGRLVGEAVDQEGRVDIEDGRGGKADQELQEERRDEVRPVAAAEVIEHEAGAVEGERDGEHDAE